MPPDSLDGRCLCFVAWSYDSGMARFVEPSPVLVDTSSLTLGHVVCGVFVQRSVGRAVQSYRAHVSAAAVLPARGGFQVFQ